MKLILCLLFKCKYEQYWTVKESQERTLILSALSALLWFNADWLIWLVYHCTTIRSYDVRREAAKVCCCRSGVAPFRNRAVCEVWGRKAKEVTVEDQAINVQYRLQFGCSLYCTLHDCTVRDQHYTWRGFTPKVNTNFGSEIISPVLPRPRSGSRAGWCNTVLLSASVNFSQKTETRVKKTHLNFSNCNCVTWLKNIYFITCLLPLKVVELQYRVTFTTPLLAWPDMRLVVMQHRGCAWFVSLGSHTRRCSQSVII